MLVEFWKKKRKAPLKRRAGQRFHSPARSILENPTSSRRRPGSDLPRKAVSGLTVQEAIRRRANERPVSAAQRDVANGGYVRVNRRFAVTGLAMPAQSAPPSQAGRPTHRLGLSSVLAVRLRRSCRSIEQARRRSLHEADQPRFENTGREGGRGGARSERARQPTQ